MRPCISFFAFKYFLFLSLSLMPLRLLCEESLFLKQGQEYLNAGMYDQAIDSFLNELEQVPLETHQDIKKKLIQAYFLQGNYLKTLEVATSLGTRDDEDEYLLASSYMALAEYEKAQKILQALYDKNNLPLYLLERGICRFYLQDFDASRQDLETCAQTTSKQTDQFRAYFYLIRLKLETDQWEDAARDIKKLPLMEPFQGQIHYLKGELSFLQKDYPKALKHFEKAYQRLKHHTSLWHKDVLAYLAECHLGLASKENGQAYRSAANYFKLLESHWPNSKATIAQVKCLIAYGEIFHDEVALQEADQLISHLSFFEETSSRTETLFLKARANASYLLKDKIYRQIIQENPAKSTQTAQAWYLKGMNEFEQALNFQKENDLYNTNNLLIKALDSVEKAHSIYQDQDPYWAIKTLIASTQIYALHPQDSFKEKAIALILNFLEKQQISASPLPSQDELLYLLSLYATHLSDAQPTLKTHYHTLAQTTLENLLKERPAGPFAPCCLNLLGILAIKENQLDLGAAHFKTLLDQFSDSSLNPEALFWLAHCHEKTNPELARQERFHFCQEYPTHPLAPEAYFRCYSYIDYLQGERAAIKHLKAFGQSFEQSPFLLNAFYLIAIDSQKDRKSPEGRWITKKNLLASIEAFQELQDAFEKMTEQKLIPLDRQDYYTMLAFRAHLEKAQTNLLIAEEADGTKKQIFLEYAEKNFSKIYQNLEDPQGPYSKILVNQQTHLALTAECLLSWARTLLHQHQEENAERLLQTLIGKYQQIKITKGFFLAKAWEEKGRIALKNQKYEAALDFFTQAQNASQGKLLNADQRLDLWIQQSHCYEGLQQLDQAILTLSKVVNDEAVSSLRLKAMYLRSEMYEKQNRSELARKQLEALAQKNGDWALKARLKLEEKYGY